MRRIACGTPNVSKKTARTEISAHIGNSNDQEAIFPVVEKPVLNSYSYQ
jgi:hypothetical protein